MSLRRLTVPLALILLAVLAAWPLLRYGPPLQAQTITDGPNHLYRFVLLDWHIQHGDLFPRWFSDLHFGYGAPVLNFYAPLSYYFLVLLHMVIPSAPAAFQWGFILALAAAAVGMFVWAREQFQSSLAGLAAAAAYCFTPYVYFSILDRAAYPELWGLALAPWLFWLALVYIRRPSPRARLAFALLYAALILVHNLSALLFSPVLALYAWLSWRDQPARLPGQLAWLAAAFMQGAGLALFFLLPFVLEAGDVHLGRAAGYVYSANFTTAAELFALPAPFDPHNVVNARPVSLPWPQVLGGLTGLGLLASAARRRGAGALVGLALGALAFGLIGLNLRASLPIWDLLAPVARLIQFPFRFLGPAMLLLAWLCAAALARFRSSIPALAALALVFFFTLTWTYHAPFDTFPEKIQPADIIRDEIAHPERVGASNLLEYVPRWVSVLPAGDSLLPRYAAASVPSRLAGLPEGVARLAERTELTASSLTYDSPAAFTAVYDIFYFPGWAASLDGRPVEIQISQPGGLITVAAPAGRHTLDLTLLPTGPKIAGALLSLLALVSLVITWRYEPRLAAPAERSSAMPLPAAGLLVLVVLIALRLLVLDRVETPFYRDGLRHVPNPLSIDFGGQLRLIGYDFPGGPTLASGGALKINLYWQPAAAPTADYHTAVQLVDGQGNRFGLSDHQDPSGLPTSRWRAGQYALDAHDLASLSGAPPGTYHIHVSVYSLQDGKAQPLAVAVEGAPPGLDYDLGPVSLTPAAPQPAGSVGLLESSLASDTVGVGDRLSFTLVWNAGPKPVPGLVAEASLNSVSGGTVYSVDLPPAGPDYPSDRWRAGQVLRYPQFIDLPPDFPAGPAHLSVRLLDAQRQLVAGPFDVGVGRVVVSVPPRSYAIPSMQHRVDYDFAGAIRLLGYDVSDGSLTLYWQALKPVATRLTVFVHALDAGGDLIAGQDNPPARPASSWLPGEVITDVHPITAGERFEVGLYEPVTGERFGQPFQQRP